MIVRSLRVEAWRCFVEALEVGPFSDGLNVVHGPNGVGKSSLFMALGRGLFDEHTSSAEAIKQLRAWGRELAPRLLIEFDHGGSTWRLRKQFLDGKAAELSRLEGGRFVPKAEGRAADQQVREMLNGESYGKKEANPQTWGLAQILWAPQGRIDVGEVAGECRQSLQLALGAQVAGGDTHEVERRVTELYSRSFTSTGKLKSGAGAPKLVGLEADALDARERAAKQRERLASFDDASRRLESLALVASQSQAKVEALAAELSAARLRAENYQRLAAEVESCRQAANAAKAQFDQGNDRVKAIAAVRGELKSCHATLQDLQAKGPALSGLVGNLTTAAELANESVEQVRTRRNQPAVARQAAKLAEQFVAAQQRATALEPKIEQVRSVQVQIESLQKQRSRLVAPDEKQLKAIQGAARLRDDARLKLDGSLISLQFTPENEVTIECLTGDQFGTRQISAGETSIFRGSPGVSVRIPGVGVLRATGPAASSDELREEWDAASKQLANLTKAFATTDLDELQRSRDAAGSLDQQLAQENLRLGTLLAGDTIDGLETSLAQAKNSAANVIREHPEWETSALSPAQLAERAEAIERQFTNDIDAAEAIRTAAVADLARASERFVGHEANLKNAQSLLRTTEERLATLESDGLSDVRRQEGLSAAAIAWRAATKSHNDSSQRLAGFGADPQGEVNVLTAQVQAVRDESASAAKRLHTEEGRLKTLIEEAPYSALAGEEESIARLEEEIARERVQLDAIRLLHETIARRKHEMVESLLGPVCQRAMQTLSRITGSRFENLTMTEGFELEAVVPRTQSKPVPLAQLSGGEREQAHFAVRLALADVVFNGEPQLVVLDDVFTFTDTARLARIATILAETSERFQIVLLTCHPERYKGLPAAKFFDLEEISARSRLATQ